MTSDQTNDAKVTVYSTSWCAFCHTEMQWLDRLGVKYITKDIEADEEAHKELMKKHSKLNLLSSKVFGMTLSVVVTLHMSLLMLCTQTCSIVIGMHLVSRKSRK